MFDQKFDGLAGASTFDFIEGLRELAGLKDDDVYHSVFLCVTLQFTLENFFTKVPVEILSKGLIDNFQEKDIFTILYGRLNFSDKIEVFKKYIEKDDNLSTRYKDITSFSHRFKDEIRNNLFHGKHQNLKYKGEDLKKIEVQEKMRSDFLAAIEKTKTA